MEQTGDGKNRGKNIEHGGGSKEPLYHVFPQIQQTTAMRMMQTKMSIYKWGWTKALDDLYINTLYSVVKEVDASTLRGVKDALCRVHFMLGHSNPSLGITISAVIDQYRRLCRRYADFQEYIRFPGVIYDPNNNRVYVSKAELRKNGVEDNMRRKYFRNYGLPHYDLMDFIFSERAAYLIKEL